MPTINKPFLAKLLLSVLVFAGLLAGAHALQARRIPDGLRRQAERAADAGKSDTAIHYLRQYLEFEPEDVDALVKLTDFLRMRTPTYRGLTELVFLYDRILRIDPDRHATRREALTACLKMSRYSDAITYAETLLTAFPTDSSLWQYLGAAQAGLNQLAEARKSYETALTHAPDDLLGYQRLAQLVWRNLNQPAEAKAVLDKLAAAMPQEPQAYYSRARFLVSQADDAGGPAADYGPALNDLRRMLELDPENADASLLLAEVLQKGRDVPAAHAILRDVVSLYPRDLRLVRGLAWLELIRGNTAAATAALEDGLKLAPDGFDLLVPLADLLVQQGDTVRSEEILKQLIDRRAPAMQVNYLKAHIAMKQERWADAIAQLEALRGETLRLPGLEARLNVLLATCFEKTADPDAQEKALRRVVSADPGNVAARVGLAVLYLNLGRFDDTAREYETAAQSPYAPASVQAQWVRLKVRRLLTVGGQAKDWHAVEQAATGAVAKFGPVSSEPFILQAEVAAAQGKYPEAVRLLRTETARRPGDTRLWAALAETAAEGAGTAAGLAVLDEAQAAAGDGPDLRLARATLYAREPGRVRPVDSLAERIDTWAEGDQLRLLYGLVEVYDQAGNREKVVELLRRITNHRPADVGVWARLHERATEAGDTKAVTAARAALVKIEGEAGPNVVLCDARAGNDSRNVDKVRAAFGPSPNRAEACLVLARAAADTGDLPEALRLTERAFALEPTRYEPTKAFTALLSKSGVDDRAAKFVARLAADSRWAGDPFRRVMAGVLEQIPPADGAKVVAWCKPLVEREPGGLGWIAGCYRTVGKSAEAEETLVAATRAPTATADDWLRLAVHQASSERAADAEATLNAARAKFPPSIFLTLAAVYNETAAGRNWTPTLSDPAEKRLFTQARLAVKLSRSESADAVKLLEAYLPEAKGRPADAGWARRNLAMLYALSASPEERQRAMKLLDSAADEGTSPEELRATAGVLTTLARHLESDDRKAVFTRAATVLQAAHKSSQSPRDLYHLAQLYRAAGLRSEGRRCLQQLLEADQKNIYYLTAALEELTDARQFPTASAFAARLTSLYPGEFRAVAAVARYECKAGQPERALALAERYAGAADAGAGDYLARSARVAELLDELARMPNVRRTPVAAKMTEAAVERYTAMVPTRPEAVIGIVGLLATEGRIADAFGKVEQFSRYLPVRVRAQAGLAALRSGGANESQFDTVAGWLREAHGESGDSPAALLSEAEFLAIRQDYAKAAQAYEVILTRDPRNVVALNNLAWMYAADPTAATKAVELIDRAAREVGFTGELLDTRARARITLKQFTPAEHDLTEALTQDATALRYFHLAVLRLSRNPADQAEAVKAFAEARTRGLDAKMIHPTDLPTYQTLIAK